MATITSGALPDKRRTYGEAFKAEALRLASESRFKAELLDSGSFPGLTGAKLEISHHIAYNAERHYSALGYCSPNHFETQLQATSPRCPA